MQTTLAWSLLALATFAETLVYGSASSPCAPQVVDKDRTVEYFILNDATHGRCSNTDYISDLTECRGQCFSKTAFNAATRNFTSSCLCCTVKASVQKRITLSCSRGSGILEMDYRNPTECSCTTCAGTYSGSSDMSVPIAL
ncbi:uncharacterized protein LOC144169988 [Haemaphysalis longicornis]